MKDTLYQQQQQEKQPFSFDQKVANVFDNMIRRSVPGYEAMIQGSIDLCQSHVSQNKETSRIYDLGCATGEATLALLSQLEQPVELIAIDCAKPMLSRAQALIKSFTLNHQIQWRLADITHTEMNHADVVLLQFTLQFIEPDKRQALIERIHHSMKPGGLLILSEKTHHLDSYAQHQLEQMHLMHKQQQGYSTLEISQKRQALDNVLITDTLDTHLDRLKKSGFRHPFCWYYNRLFASIACYKTQ